MGTAASLVNKEELQDLAEGTVFSETEIKFLVKRFLCLDPTGTQGVAIDDILDLPELALNPVVAGLVPLYATWDEEDPKDRDKARVHLSNFIHMMSLLSPKTSVKEKLQKLFIVFDGDGDGKLSDTDLYQAFKMFIGHQQADQQIKGLINAVLYKNGERQAHLPVTEFIKLIPPTELREKLTVELPTS